MTAPILNNAMCINLQVSLNRAKKGEGGGMDTIGSLIISNSTVTTVCKVQGRFLVLRISLRAENRVKCKDYKTAPNLQTTN